MILDHLNNHSRYSGLHPHFQKSFDFLQNVTPQDFENEKTEINGEECFALFMKGTGKGKSDYKMEAHRKYIDIQYVLRGNDLMAYRPLLECSKIHTPYKDKEDYLLVSDPAIDFLLVKENQFTIFFPEDAHAPLLGTDSYWKIVIKVKILDRSE
jgi:YhcH/YjgK/YiaL family protein